MKPIRIAATWFALLLLAGCPQGEKKARVGYIQITQDVVLDTAKKGVFAALRDSGFVDGQSINVLDNNAQGDLSLIPTILQSLQSQGVDLIVTNSTPCMVAAAQSVANVPVVFTVAFSPEQVGMKTTPTNLYGVYDPLDVQSFVSLMRECVPTLTRVGLPYNNAEPNAEYAAKAVAAELESRGITVIKTTVNSANDIVMAGQYLAGQHIDALVAAADNTVYMGLHALARIASEAKIPLFVTEPHQAEKGAAIGMGVNYERWGYLSGLKAAALLKGERVGQKIEPITETEIVVNAEACKAQGLTVPSSVLAKATVLTR